MTTQMFEGKETKEKFREIVRNSSSSEEILYKIRQESEPAHSHLFQEYECWRPNGFGPPKQKENHGFFTVVIPKLLLLSPIIGLVVNTVRAVTDSYGNVPELLQDPGHRRIRIYDNLMAFTSLAVGIFIVVIDNNFDIDTLSLGEAIFVIFFPQLTGWVNFFILYGISALLHFYDTRRSVIIRQINEQEGVW